MMAQAFIFAEVLVKSEMMKRCSVCGEKKELATEFYEYRGTYRGACKKCTIVKNNAHQKKNKTWQRRGSHDESMKEYRKKYYEDNKEKFVEYRKTFKERRPEYFKEYARRRKNNTSWRGSQSPYLKDADPWDDEPKGPTLS